MKKICSIFILLIFLIAVPSAEARRNKVIMNDFTNVNLFDAFYIYDKNSQNYKFVPLSKYAYIKLDKDNKAIYDKVVDANSDWQNAKSAVTYRNSLNYYQDAYKKNPDLLPVAYTLVEKFSADKKYNTALYYAEKIKKKDKRELYPTIDFTIAELNYQLGEYQTTMDMLIAYLNTLPCVKTNNPEVYYMIGDSYLNLYKTQLKTQFKIKQGIFYMNKALTMRPDELKYWEVKYNLCMIAGDYKCTDEVVKSVYAINPHHQIQLRQ